MSPAPDTPPVHGAEGRQVPWVHRNADGMEVGVEQPTGVASGPLVAFRAALAATWLLREALWVLVLRDFKLRYRAQALGLFWSLAHPLVMMATVTIAFAYILEVRIPNFSVFYLIGAVFWQFFTNSTLAATGSLVDHSSAVKQNAFPRFLLPIAAVLSHLIHLAMEMVLVFAFFLFFPSAYRLNETLLALPFVVLLALLVVFGVALVTSGLFAKYRDVYYLVTSLFTVGFWATPILYPVSMVPSSLQGIIRLNPATGVIESARAIIMRGTWPSLADIGPAFAVGTILFFGGCISFRRQNLTVADYA